MKMLLPVYNSGPNALFCNSARRDLAQLKGAQIAAGGQAQTKEIGALGAAAASIPYTELFESLERGVVSCSMSSLTVAVLGGFIPAAPHVLLDPDAGFALAPGAMAMSTTTWESLPLVAKQLFYDRLDVFVKGNIEDKIWPNTVEAVKQVKKANGSVETFSDDARAAVKKANDGILQELRSNTAVGDGDAFVDAVQAASARWLTLIKDLGYENETDYNGFADWYTAGKVDLDPYVNKLFEEIFLKQRPATA
ncbi:type 2 periplasmic-binding domain-containing protein [Thermocatellispora tengchongensis]